MEFLARQDIYHGDLAARNILLTGDLVAKISDFGLSRRLAKGAEGNLFDMSQHTSIQLPIKWMALEILENGNFSQKSDVWSFGILLWEIFNFGLEPYAHGK